ncbi:MAG: ribonuclease PH [Candidatus Latescibacteria bacterium]|nr:ribonuclease PH [Candidatus Latescibacterota bacterium]
MSATRKDGRRPDQLRPATITPHFLNTAPGSALIEMGHTKVICTVSIEERVPPFLVGKEQGWLTAEYGMLPGSSPRRIEREGARGKINSRSREIQRLIGRSLRAVVNLKAVGERTLHIDCDVIQADGGTRTASITGAYVALVLAVDTLDLDVDPIGQAAAAISCGLVGETSLLDLCYEEDVRAETDMNVVMTADGGLVEVQATAEGRPFTRAETDQMLDLAEKGIAELLQIQRHCLQTK